MARLHDPEKALIKAAKEILVENGLDGLNARAVAKRAGCAVGSLYNYFQSMTEIILQINAETLLALKGELKEAVKEKTKEALSRSISRKYIGFAKSNLPFWNLLYEYKMPKDQKLPKWYQQLVEDLFRIVEQALKQHLPKDPKVSNLATRVLWAGVHGILMLEMTGKLDIAQNEPAEVLCDSLFDQYLKS